MAITPRARERTWSPATVAGVLAAAVVVTFGLTMTAFTDSPEENGAQSAKPTALTPTATPTYVLSNGFEDATVQGWRAHDGSQVRSATATAYNGQRSLLVSGRTSSPPGTSRDLRGTVRPGAEYTLSVWLRLPAGVPATAMRLAVSWGSSASTRDAVLATQQANGGGWVYLEGTYTAAGSLDVLTADISPVNDTVDFFVDDFVVTELASAPPSQIPALKDVFADSFEIGAAISNQQLVGAEADLLKGQFNSITPTNALKWTTTEPTPNAFNFANADKIVDFAVAHGIRVRGHTLVWHNQTPDWVFLDAAGQPMTPTAENKALLLSRMENHIRALLGQYRGKIATWDVVNEVLNDDGSMRQSRWYQVAGLNYIEHAFRTARAADPTVKLCLNDVSLAQPKRRDAMLQLVAGLKSQGVPIDCIGSQTHINIAAPTPAAVRASIETFAQLGVDQQITEMDVSVYADNVSSYPAIPADLLAKQAEQYKALFEVYRQYRDQISSVTFWGLADNDTWLSAFPIVRTDAPLLFARDLTPKPAFWAVVGVKPTS